MCSLRGVNVITLAAIFCTRCSLRSKLVERFIITNHVEIFILYNTITMWFK